MRNITDAVRLLRFLFDDAPPPVPVACAEGPEFLDLLRETREELNARIAAVETAIPQIVTGTYVGDGTEGRRISTGLSGSIQALWLAGRCGEDEPGCTARGYYFRAGWTTSEMEPGLSAGDSGPIVPRLDGAEFLVSESDRSNRPTREYMWVAITGP